MTARVCYDWSPLGYSDDPIPGDPDKVEGAATSYSTTADAINQVSDYLANLDSDGQQSETITALKARARELSGHLLEVSSRYTETAGALRYYAPELRAAQAMADAAMAQGAPAESQRKAAASNAHNIYVGWMTTLEPTQAQEFEQSYQSAKHQADMAAEQVQQAKSKINEAISRRDQAAEHAKAMIQKAIENSPASDTLLDHFNEILNATLEGIKKVGQWIWDNIDTIALVLTIASAVVAFIPGLDVIAPVLAVAAKAATILARVKAGVETAKGVVTAVKTGDVSGLVGIGASALAGYAFGKFSGVLTGAVGDATKSVYGKALHAMNKSTSQKVWGKLSTIVTGKAASGLTQAAAKKAMAVADSATKTEIQKTLTQLTRATVSGKTNRLISDMVGDQVKDKLDDVLFSSTKDKLTTAAYNSAKFQTDVLINTIGGGSGQRVTTSGSFNGAGSSGGW